MGEIVGEIDFFGFGEADLHESELRLVAVDLDPRLDLDEIVAIDVFRHDFKLLPHARFDCAAAVAEFEAEIGAAFTGVADFFFVNEEKSGDGLLGEQLGDEARLHAPEAVPARLPNSRNFLRPFLGPLPASGVALTSWISELPPPAMS